MAASEANNSAQATAAQNEHQGVWLEAWPADRRRLVFGMVLLNFELKLQGTVVLRQCVSKLLGMMMLKMCMRD
jgi:hypothetical protein